jgi:hypothetical protein
VGGGRECRRRLEKAFDARGIEIPFPRTRSPYVDTASAPLEVMLKQGSGADDDGLAGRREA